MRPKFSWDVNNPFWTDGRDALKKFYKNVVLWKEFHDVLPAEHRSNLPDSVQGLVLKSALYVRAADKIEKLSLYVIKGDDGSITTAQKIYKLDPLSVISDAYSKFQVVVSTVRGGSKSFFGSESRFDAAFSNYHAVCKETKLPSVLLASLHLSHAQLEGSQRVSILACVSFNLRMSRVAYSEWQSASTVITNGSTTTLPSAVINQLRYDAVASVMRSFNQGRDKPNTTSTVFFHLFSHQN